MCALQERARPEFEQRIKRYIRNCKDDNAREKFFVYNPVLEKKEYVQPAHWFFPKVIATFSILIAMVRSIGECKCMGVHVNTCVRYSSFNTTHFEPAGPIYCRVP